MVLIAYRYYSFEAYDFSNVIVGLYSASVFSTQTPFGTMYHVNGACPKSAGIILLHKYHVFSILVAKKKKRQLLIENNKLPYKKKKMQRQCLLSVMKLTACSTKETTCTAVLHSIWEDELNLGLEKNLLSVHPLAEGKGSGCTWQMLYLMWRVWDEPTAEGFLVFCLALELHSDAPQPAERHQRNLGALGWGGFGQFPHPFRGWGDCALQSEGKIKGVGRRLGASKLLECLFRLACWLSLHCMVFCGGLLLPVTRGPQPTGHEADAKVLQSQARL